MLGPYRNLTTLTAAVLFLHPQCQVLNHAGIRIFGGERDLFEEYSSRRVDEFIRYAIRLSAGGARGAYGGSITLSHAFDGHHRVRSLFEQAGLPLVKNDIRALLWKESHRIANRIHDPSMDLDGFFSADSRLRFLMPVRNPLDCSVSNIRTGHVRFFKGLRDSKDVGEVCEAVLDEIRRVLDVAKQFPGRVLYFFEHSIDDQMLISIEEFLQINHNADWLRLAREAMTSTSRYVHSPAL
jgi:hypothetical protein